MEANTGAVDDTVTQYIDSNNQNMNYAAAALSLLPQMTQMAYPPSSSQANSQFGPTQSIDLEVEVGPMRCCRQDCKVKDGELKLCQRNECRRYIHVSCFEALSQKYNLVGLKAGMVACTKLCYTKSIKELEKEEQEKEGLVNLPWEKDGKGGKRGGKESC